MGEPYNLDRFLHAQEYSYDQALAEMRAGRKRSHWMWFIFPQFKGLGRSPTADHYAIGSVEEAEAYLRHSLLGPRLIECAEAVLATEGKSAADVFGYPDDLKLRSCATLFARVSPPESVFEQLLTKYFEGRPDQKTVDLLSQGSP